MKPSDTISPARQAHEEKLWEQPFPRKSHQTHFTVPELPWKKVSTPDNGPGTDEHDYSTSPDEQG